MVGTSKRKGKKAVTRRLFDEQEGKAEKAGK